MSDNIEKYIGQGFIEALIAVAITGIAGVLLLSVSIRTINQTLKNEAYDEVTNMSSNLGNKIAYFVDLHNNSEIPVPNDPINIFLDSPGSCFAIKEGFLTELDYALDINLACGYSLSNGKVNRENCGLSNDIGVFSLVCVNINSNSSILSLDLISGDIGCNADECNDFVDKEIYLLK